MPVSAIFHLEFLVRFDDMLRKGHNRSGQEYFV